MRELTGYFKIPFANPHISLPALLAFTTDHFQKMKANNPGGLWDARLAAMEMALDAIMSSDAGNLRKLGLRKGSKNVKGKFRREMRERLGRVHAAMLARYGLRSAEIKMVFAKSRGRIARAPDDLLIAELRVVSEEITARAADLAADIVTEAQTLLADWTAIWQASEVSTAQKRAAQEVRRVARAALQVELFKNLLAIAAQFPGEPEKLKWYMQQSLLRVGRKKRE